MKLFETSDGRFLNPALVTNCYATQTEGQHIARFFFGDGYSVDVASSSKSYAEGEIKAFAGHCEER